MTVSHRAIQLIKSSFSWKSFVAAMNDLQSYEPDVTTAIYYRLGMTERLNVYAAQVSDNISVPKTIEKSLDFASNNGVSIKLAHGLALLAEQVDAPPTRVTHRVKSRWSIARKLRLGKTINDLLGVEMTFKERDFLSGAVLNFVRALPSQMEVTGYFNFPACSIPQQIDLPVFLVNGLLNKGTENLNVQVKIRAENYHFAEMASSYFQHKCCNIDSFALSSDGYRARSIHFSSLEASGRTTESLHQMLFDEIRSSKYSGQDCRFSAYDGSKSSEVIKRWKIDLHL